MQTVKIEKMTVGARYVDTHPGYENGWIVETTERRQAQIDVWRNGAWFNPTLVTVTYRNGISITHEIGTDIAVETVIR